MLKRENCHCHNNLYNFHRQKKQLISYVIQTFWDWKDKGGKNVRLCDPMFADHLTPAQGRAVVQSSPLPTRSNTILPKADQDTTYFFNKKNLNAIHRTLNIIFHFLEHGFCPIQIFSKDEREENTLKPWRKAILDLQNCLFPLTGLLVLG